MTTWRLMMRVGVVLLAAMVPGAGQALPAFTPPAKVVVVSDDNYPPFLFRDADGALRGIVKDKWDLWSRRTGVAVEVRGSSWAKAQESMRRGEADVIEALAHTPARAALYEFPVTPATMEARVYFHHTIAGIKDAASMRGFTVGAKEGSACAEWLRAHQVESIRAYPDSQALVNAAGAGEVRMFCMDALAAQYFLYKSNLADEFRQTPILYEAPFDWAVLHGRAELRDFVQDGFARIRNQELAEIDGHWRGNPLHFPIGARYLAYLVAAGLAVLGISSLLLFRNHCLRRLVYGKTAELITALESLKKYAARAEYFATRDTLTSLANRQLLLDRLTRSLARAKRWNRQVGLLFINLDRFRAVNDTFGQEFGDLVLKKAAERLVRCAGPGATVARVSGDEFVIILGRTTADEALAVAKGALTRIRRPFDVGGQRVYCTASAGVAVYPGDGTTPAELIRNAAIAMDCAKENGRNDVQQYRPEMQHLAARRHALETGLRGALERNEFEVHYQAKVTLATGKVSGFEALLRWRHPEQGLLAPAEFITVLEDTGLIVGVGEWVLRTACEQIKKWEALGSGAPSVAVNLSARQFHQRDLDRVIARILAETGIDATKLELELTESMLMREPEEAVRTLEHLRGLGIRVAVDDFGTGYSSLAYLKRFPIAALKIDRTFIQDITLKPEDAAITKAIIHLAHSLGLTVVAEGVETEAQIEFLKAHGCDQMQGYLFSPPLPAEEAGYLL